MITDIDRTLENKSVHAPKQHRRLKSQDQSHIHALFPGVLSASRDLISVEIIFGINIACQYQRDTGRKSGFQRRRTRNII